MHIARSTYPMILAVAALGACTPPQPPAAEELADRETVRILAYNIKHGEGMDGIIDLERAARVIRELDPDIVALQEIDSVVERTSRVDQASRLGELTGMHSVFGAFFDYQGGRYGMALLSKFPIKSYANHWLPEGTEPRTGLAARIELLDSKQEIIIVGIHLYRTPEQRYAQARGLVDIYRNETTPVILAGDFNSLPDSDVLALLRRHWHVPAKGADRLTYPSDEPQREIDYIMYRPPDRFEVVEHKVIHEPLVSDHRPVLIELRLLDPTNRN